MIESRIHIIKAVDAEGRRKGRLAFSGYNATGDAKLGPPLYVVRVVDDVMVHSDGLLMAPKFSTLEGFTPEAVVLAARRGMFGFTFA